MDQNKDVLDLLRLCCRDHPRAELRLPISEIVRRAPASDKSGAGTAVGNAGAGTAFWYEMSPTEHRLKVLHKEQPKTHGRRVNNHSGDNSGVNVGNIGHRSSFDAPADQGGRNQRASSIAVRGTAGPLVDTVNPQIRLRFVDILLSFYRFWCISAAIFVSVQAEGS
jgi:hypothetical protein